MRQGSWKQSVGAYAGAFQRELLQIFDSTGGFKTTSPRGPIWHSEITPRLQIPSHKAQEHALFHSWYLLFIVKGELDWIFIIPHINPLHSASAESAFRASSKQHLCCISIAFSHCDHDLLHPQDTTFCVLSFPNLLFLQKRKRNSLSEKGCGYARPGVARRPAALCCASPGAERLRLLWPPRAALSSRASAPGSPGDEAERRPRPRGQALSL